MPTVRLRKRLLDRLVKSASGASELGLALLMTAGVIHCGGATQGEPGEGAPDAAADHRLAVEAAQEGGSVIEAGNFLDAGADAHISPMVEAPMPPSDAGADAHGLVVEGGTFSDDAGSDASRSPWVEAPAPH